MLCKYKKLVRISWTKLLLATMTFAVTPAIYCRCAIAEVVIEVGAHALLPNTANQSINIRVLSTDPASDPLVSGLNLNVELGDGVGKGAEPVFQGAEGSLEGIVFSTGIFAGNSPSGQGPAANFPQLISAGIASAGDVDPSGILISLLIDTTGFSQVGQEFPITLAGHQSPFPFDTQLLGPLGNAIPISLAINNGLLSITSPATLAGDYNGNGTVDAADYTLWRDTLGQIVSLGTSADGDGNGTIDGSDYAVWQQHYGSVMPGGSILASIGIPEPTALGLIVVGLMTMNAKRRDCCGM